MGILGLDDRPRIVDSIQSKIRWKPNSVECWVVGIFGAIGVLTFFFPLISFQIPILGQQNFSGYDLVSRPGDVKQRLGAALSDDPSKAKTEPVTPNSEGKNEDKVVSRTPISIQLSPLLPIFILAALASAAVLVVTSMLRLGFMKIASAVGGAFGIVSILHITVMASDMRSVMQSSMITGAQELQGNPFAGLANAIGAMMMNSFRFEPGGGLWVLASCLGVAALIVQSGLLHRFRLVMSDEKK